MPLIKVILTALLSFKLFDYLFLFILHIERFALLILFYVRCYLFGKQLDFSR